MLVTGLMIDVMHVIASDQGRGTVEPQLKAEGQNGGQRRSKAGKRKYQDGRVMRYYPAETAFQKVARSSAEKLDLPMHMQGIPSGFLIGPICKGMLQHRQ